MTPRPTVWVVVNPRATRVQPDTHRRIVDALGDADVAQVIITQDAAHTVEEAHRARREGVDVVVTLGGDGTVQAVAAALAGGSVALLPMPGGSTNVFTRGLGWPFALDECLAGVGAALRNPPRHTHLGLIRLDRGEERVMCVNAGIGVDAATVRWVEENPHLKHRFKQGAFAAAAVGPGARAFLGRPRLLVSMDDHPPVPVASFLAACGRPYTFVGARRLDLLPRADWDGTLEWLGIARGNPLGAGRAVVGALRGGAHLAAPLVMGGTTRGHVRVESRNPVDVQADGEALGTARAVTIRPGPVLRALVPAPPA